MYIKQSILKLQKFAESSLQSFHNFNYFFFFWILKMNNFIRSATPPLTPYSPPSPRQIRRVVSSPDVPPILANGDVASSGGQKILRMIFMKKLDHWDEDGIFLISLLYFRAPQIFSSIWTVVFWFLIFFLSHFSSKLKNQIELRMSSLKFISNKIIDECLDWFLFLYRFFNWKISNSNFETFFVFLNRYACFFVGISKVLYK